MHICLRESEKTCIFTLLPHRLQEQNLSLLKIDNTSLDVAYRAYMKPINVLIYCREPAHPTVTKVQNAAVWDTRCGVWCSSRFWSLNVCNLFFPPHILTSSLSSIQGLHAVKLFLNENVLARIFLFLEKLSRLCQVQISPDSR